MKTLTFIPLFALLAFTAGCTTSLDGRRVDQRSIDQAREQTARENALADVDRLKARVEGLELAQQDQLAQLAALKEERAKDQKDFRDGLVLLDRAINEAQAGREADKQAIINDLTDKIAGIAQKLQGGASVRPPSGSGTPKTAPENTAETGGRVHVIKTGETLSSIATAYKIKVQALIEANGIKNPNTVRIGQKLVIPE